MNVASVLKVGGQTHPTYLDNKKTSQNHKNPSNPLGWVGRWGWWRSVPYLQFHSEVKLKIRYTT